MVNKGTRVTVKMIAEKAGVSIGTVDRALNNREGINEESKQHILRIAEELEYRPNKLASALSRKKILRIGVVYPKEPEVFFTEITKGIELATEELLDYGITVNMIRYETSTQKAARECLASINLDQYDGFAINSVGGNMNSSYIDDFMDKGKATITFNSDLPLSSRLFFIGSNSWQSGTVAAELLVSYLGERAEIAILNNFSSTSPFLERCGGFYEYMHMFCPDIPIYPSKECYTDEVIAENTLLELIDQYPKLNGVYCSGYATTIGAVNALKKLNRKDIIVVGFGITCHSAKALKEGWCKAVLYQKPMQQGYYAARLLAKHMLEGWLPTKQHLFLETPIVVQSNVDQYCGNNMINF